MGPFGGNQTDASERYYPVPAPEVFKALNEVVPQLFNSKSSDDFTLCCTFTSDLQGVEFTRDPKYVVVPRRERLRVGSSRGSCVRHSDHRDLDKRRKIAATRNQRRWSATTTYSWRGAMLV